MKKLLRRWLGLDQTDKMLALHIKLTRAFIEASKEPLPPHYISNLSAYEVPQPGDVIVPNAIVKGYGRPD